MSAIRKKIFVSIFLLMVFFAFAEKADAAILRMKPSQANVTVGNIVNIKVEVLDTTIGWKNTDHHVTIRRARLGHIHSHFRQHAEQLIVN